ncbi:MAG TPA: extracellular solute-binding protein [Candidatus Limnocylindrales bacterium]
MSVALLGMSACSGAATTGAPASAGAPATAGAATTGDITWWGWTPDATNATKLIAAFNKDYPGIKVTFVSKPIDSYDSVLGPAITSSKGPDVFDVAPGSANGGVQTFAPGAVDLTDTITAALGSDWKTKVAAAGVDPMTSDGKLVGLSVGAVYSGWMWINQDIFDKYNLKAPTNMAEWKTVCSTLEANGVGCFVQGAAQWAFDMDTFEAICDNIEPGLYIQATQGKVAWTDARFVKAMGIWKSLFDEGIMQQGAIGLQQYPDANNAFMAGKYAMVMMGTWYTQYAVKDSMLAAMSAAGVSNPTAMTLTPVPFPDLAGTGKTGSMFGDADYGFAVSAKSSQQDAAKIFAAWLATSQTGQQAVANTLNQIPALKGIGAQWDQIDLVNSTKQQDALKAYQQAASAATEPRFATVSADLNTAFRDALIGVATGDKTADQALAALQAVPPSK